MDENVGDYQRGFQGNISTTDHIFYILQILEERCEYNETAHQLLKDFKKGYDSIRREVLDNILIDFGVPIKLMRLVKMCLNTTHNRVCIGKHLS
jgi:hypothetical protein